MEIDLGDIVLSLSGRDKKRLFFVLKTQSGFAWLADGRMRKIENPKKKNLKHLKLVSKSESGVSQKIRNSEKVLNSEIRRTLAGFAQGDGEADASDAGR
ncbi:MAG: RNA-binding protein [Clostridiales bacterium]|jgi:large subunit ribosomal protein L14e|nr:RNA-binding protein [Clostridiales bacterium]